jgi:hypothetical protein
MSTAELYVVDENGNKIAVIIPLPDTSGSKKIFTICQWLPNGGMRKR